MLPNSFGRSTSAETDDSRMTSPMQAIAISECQRRLRTAAAYDASSGRSWKADQKAGRLPTWSRNAATSPLAALAAAHRRDSGM